MVCNASTDWESLEKDASGVHCDIEHNTNFD